VADSLETRFVAASLFLGLPDMFHRQARGQQLLADVVASPLLAQAPLPFRGAVWLRAGQAAAQATHKDEARRWYAEVVASNAPQAALARTRLQELGR
jgi:predicted TPR repeat methyltransferase